jgi:hypothetical protein
MRYSLSTSATAILLAFSLSSCDDQQRHHDTLDELKQEVHDLKSQLESQERRLLSTGPTVCLGEGQYPVVAPDGKTRVEVTSSQDIFAGWRYWGFLHNELQGMLTDNTNGQRWYVYAQLGAPGSEKTTWYAYPVEGKGEIMGNSFAHSR